MFAKAGKLLIDAVDQEYEQAQMSSVFQRARSHFSNFTHHNYDLRLGGETHAARLIAIDLSNREGRKLMNCRMARVLNCYWRRVSRLPRKWSKEDGCRCFSTRRSIRAIQNVSKQSYVALVVWHSRNRQIFYLTSDPLDTDRIRHALAKDNCEIAAAINSGRLKGGCQRERTVSLKVSRAEPYLRPMD